MENNEALNSETFEWKQKKLEQGKFPCNKCQHFESVHVKGACIACHETEADIHRKSTINCFHKFERMDNLTLVEWFAKHKENS